MKLSFTKVREAACQCSRPWLDEIKDRGVRYLVTELTTPGKMVPWLPSMGMRPLTRADLVWPAYSILPDLENNLRVLGFAVSCRDDKKGYLFSAEATPAFLKFMDDNGIEDEFAP